MNTKKTAIWLGMGILTGLLLMSQTAFADRDDWRGHYRAWSGSRSNWGEYQRNRFELRKDLAELHRDRMELWRDLRHGASRAEIAQDRRELREDYLELRRDRFGNPWYKHGDGSWYRYPAYRWGWWNRFGGWHWHRR